MGDSNKSSSSPDITLNLDEDSKKFNTNQSVEFHHLLAKLLFAAKQNRPDTCTTVSLLTTGGVEPDNYYWEKLVHLIKYLMGTWKLSLNLSANGNGILNRWIGRSFAVHTNTREEDLPSSVKQNRS